MLEINHFYKSYDSKILFEDTTAFFDGASPIMIVGKSDSGKSVLLRCIAGLEQFEGKIKLHGRARIGYYPQKISAPEFLSGYQFLEIAAMNTGIDYKHQKEIIIQAGSKSGLSLRQLRVPIKAYNIYEKKRLQLSAAFIEKCEICLMDGLFDAFDENNSGEAINIVKEMSSYSMVVVTAGDCTYAQKIGAQVWNVSDRHLIKGENI